MKVVLLREDNVFSHVCQSVCYGGQMRSHGALSQPRSPHHKGTPLTATPVSLTTRGPLEPVHTCSLGDTPSPDPLTSGRLAIDLKAFLLMLKPKKNCRERRYNNAQILLRSANVDSKECLWACTYGFKHFSGMHSSLGITNGNRSHNKPLELIWTI